MKKFQLRIISVVCALALLLSCLSGVMIFSSAETSGDDIKNAAKNYVALNGNKSTMSGLLSAVQAVASNATLVEEDYFLYHAVDGVYDEDPVEADRLSIPGHDGYVAAIFTVGDERISVIETIPHEEENLGVLSKLSTSDANAKEIFNISTGGQWRGFVDASGITEYEKIIIDTNITSIFPCNWQDFVSNAKVIILRNSGSYAGDWTWSSNNGVFRGGEGKGFHRLKAVYMDDCITNGNYFAGGRTNNDFAGMTTLKYFRFPENGVVFNTGYGDFNSATSLENVNMQVLGALDSDYGNSFDSCTSLYSVYLSENAARGLSGGPTNRVVMTYAQQQTATFARAAVLASSASEKITIDNCTNSDDALALIKASYEDKISGVTAEWTKQLNINEYGMDGQLTLSYNGDKFVLDFYDSKYLTGLDIGYDLTPSFAYNVLNYAVTVPYGTDSFTVNAQAANGATVLEIIGADNVPVGDSVIRISVKADEVVNYTINVTRQNSMVSGGSAQNVEAIKRLTKAYVSQKGNDSTMGGLLEAVQAEITNARLVAEDFFIYHAVDGVYDEDPDPEDRLSIPGHDGYVSAIFSVGDERISVIETIPHEEENLGVLSKISTSDANAGEIFSISSGGQWRGFVDASKLTEYEKIIIDTNITSIYPCAWSEFVSNAKVLILRNSGSYAGDWQHSSSQGLFRGMDGKGFHQLKAVYMDDCITNGNYFAGARTNYDFCDLETLKYFRFPENGVTFNTSYRDFNSCTSLENINTWVLGSLDGNDKGESFNGCSALYSVYLGENYSNTGLQNGPANRVTMTYAQQKTATFARAAVLAKIAADELGAVDYKNASDALATIKSAFSDKINGVYCTWRNAVTENAYGCEGSFAMSLGTDEFVIDITASKYLSDIGISYELKPAFSYDTLEYTVQIPEEVDSINVNAVPAKGATVGTITGNTNFEVNVPKTIVIPVTAADTSSVEYKITVTRRGIIELNDALIKDIRDFAADFEATNYVSQKDLQKYMNDVEKKFFVTAEVSDFFKYNSVQGAKQKNEIIVPGHNGYVSAMAKISNGVDSISFPILITIEPKMKVYNFSEDEISKEEEFTISDDGTVCESYNGNAKLIIFPKTVKTIAAGWFRGDEKENIKAIVVPDNVQEIPDKFAFEFTYLEACYLGNGIGEIPGYSFYKCYYLQYLHLPSELAMLGSCAFQFTMALPEVYLPVTLETIAGKAFWITGIRNIELPKNFTNLGMNGIAYPQFRGGIWAEPTAQSPEMVADLTAIMAEYQFDKNYQMVSYFGDKLSFQTGAFTCSNNGNVGGILKIRAREDVKDTVFAGKVHNSMEWEWVDTMNIAEVVARVQVALDHILVTSDYTADEAMQIVNDAFHSTTVTDITWKEPFAINGNKVNGVISVSDGTYTYDLTLDKDVYTSNVSSGLDKYKAYDGSLELDIKLPESSEDDKETAPDVDTNTNTNTNTDNDISTEEPEEEPDEIIEAEDENGTTVEIRISKIASNKLSKAVLAKVSDYSYMAFNLSMSSEKDVKLNGKLGVAVPIPEGFDGSLCSIYYIDGDKLRNMDAKVNGDNLVFRTTILADYIIVQDKTDYTPIIIGASVGGGLLLVVIGLGIFLIIRHKKKAL